MGKSSVKYFLLVVLAGFSLQALADTKQTQRLFDAIENDNLIKGLKRAKKAIAKNADVNSYNVDGKAPDRIPLSRATRLGRTEIVRTILETNKAEVDKRVPIIQYTPLMIAAQKDRGEIAKLLLDYGANPNEITSPFMRAALNIAALRNSPTVVKVLLAHPTTDINTRDELCPLAVAARQGHVEIVQMIYDVREEKKLNPKCLESAINMAKINKHEDVLKILVP